MMRSVLLLTFVLGCILVTADHGHNGIGDGQLTDHFAMELHKDANPHEIAAKHGHYYLGKVGSHENIHHFKKKSSTQLGDTHPHHDENEHVLWSEQQVKRLREKRQVFPEVEPKDPEYPQQWHLKPESNVNVQGAWSQGFTGSGINIAVVDDGIQRDHPDLEANYRKDLSYDFNYWDDNPYPDAGSDDHGTSAAGVAAAGVNNACGVGAAPKAGLAAIRLISVSSTDVQEGAALNYKSESNHIYTNSWGPTDDGRRKEGPGKLASATLKDGIERGREGKGSIYCWAGGNGRGSRDNCNYDGWANSRYTITVAAVDYNGRQSYYSESCSMLLVSAPSSGSGKYITTTDLMGSRGTNRGDCTYSFGGTSAAAPLAAGVMALVLEANPNLTWRDMQKVLLKTAKKNDEGDSEWFKNGAGYWYSHKYGFGVLDAGAACKYASVNYTYLPTQELNSTETTHYDAKIPPRGFHTIEIEIKDDFVMEHTRVAVWATVAKRGELSISLRSPAGTLSKLAEQHHDVGSDYQGWDFGSVANWGESTKGKYQILFENGSSSSEVIVTSIKLTAYGHASS